MFTRPEELSDETVAGLIASDWPVEVESAEYMAVGFGSHHWSVIAAGGDRWFATVDDLQAKRHEESEPLEHVRSRLDAALRTARRLRDHDLEFVVAPIPNRYDNVLSAIDHRFVAALYPWIDGRSHGYGAYENDTDRTEVFTLLSRLHGVDPADAPEARREDFAVPNRAGLMAALDDRSRWQTGPYGEPASRLLAERADEVIAHLDRYDRLAAHAAAMPDRVVVTHGEPHAANTIATLDGRVLVDWDTALIAPPERDLWMVLEASAPTTPPSYAPAGSVEVEPDLIDLYRMLWDLMEIAGYITYFRATHTETADAAESWQNLTTYLDISGRWPSA